VSVLSLTVISLDRYFAICKPLKVRSFYTNKRVIIIILLIWIVSMVVMSPLIFVNNVRYFFLNERFKFVVCMEEWPNFKYKVLFQGFIFFITFILPVIIMIWCLARVAKKMWKNDEICFTNMKSNKTIQKRKPSTTTCLESTQMKLEGEKNVNEKCMEHEFTVIKTS